MCLVPTDPVPADPRPKYIVVSAAINYLIKLVNERMNTGYVPQGGICYVPTNPHRGPVDEYMQAMVLK
jgi:hypothetical protein